MISFLVVGDGFAAAKVGAAAASVPGARLAAVASTQPRPVEMPWARNEVEEVSTGFLRQEAGLVWARQLGADWLVCINSTVILPAALIALFNGRAINCHPGPLPEYAGLHVHQWAIRNGATEFGVTLHWMEARVDTGPIIASRRFPIRPDDTGLSLFHRTMLKAADLTASVVERIAAGDHLPCIPQDSSRRRLYRHCDALDGRISWHLPHRAVINFIRAGNYEPFKSPTFVPCMEMPSGTTVEVLRAEPAGATDRPPGSLVAVQESGPVLACGDGQALRITRARDRGGLIDCIRWQYHLGYANTPGCISQRADPGARR